MKPLVYCIIAAICICYSCSSNEPITEPEQTADELYYPPINSDTWEEKSISDLGWDESKLQPLLDFLEEKNTKSFMILHEGKIVVEEYMNNHNADKLWYWASAGKTLTSTVSGIAQGEGLLDINNKVSDYLGTGWTSAPLDKENLITCKHLLSMTSGLDDSLGDSVSPENLQYKADANTRWAYHNTYVKMQDVVATASNQTWNSYFNTKLRDKIGMSAAPSGWLNLNDLSVYWSDTRSMARFGLLVYAKGKWENTQIISDSFLNEATNTSQNINNAYGYLWWLNGKTSYHLPSLQFEFDGELIPNAPADMYAALGKNDQKIYVVPSKKIVVIRMGESAGTSNFALSTFDDELWENINGLIN